VSPNPTRAGASIRLVTPGAGPRDARVTVYDLRGALVATPLDGPAGPGATVVTWDGRDAQGRDVPSGVYFVRAESAGEIVARKVLVLR
jgi:flagellar hook assembly protein FlgD